MASFTIERTGLPVLQFNGEELVDLAGCDPDGSTGGRVHDVSVYRTEDGEFIVEISYRSPHSSEVSDDYVEAVESTAEIEEILSLYDPTERMDRSLFGQHESNRVQVIADALTRRYDQQVARVIDSFETAQTLEA